MKKLLLVAFACLSFFSRLSAAPPDTLQTQVRQMVKEALENGSYTRVPTSQFEESLSNQVTSAVYRQFQFVYWIVGVIAFVLGASILYIAKSWLNERAKESIKDILKTETDKIKMDLQTISTDLKTNVDAKLQEVDSKLREVQLKLENADRQLTETKKEILGIRLEKIKQEVDNRNVSDVTFRALKSSLKESETLIDPELTSSVINILSKASYELRKETDMEKVVQGYQNDEKVKLDITVFLNLAAGFWYNYYSTFDESDRSKCIYYINETLRRAFDYGEAFGLKLELLMIDYTRSLEVSQQQKLEKEMKDILDLAVQSRITSSEVLKRYERVRVNEQENSCISAIEKKFPAEIDALKNKSLAEV